MKTTILTVVFSAVAIFLGLATPDRVMAQPSLLDPPATQITAGQRHTCVLTAEGGVKCWGNNSNGQLGDGTTAQRLTPVDVLGLTSGVVTIAAGGFHTCALTTVGGVKCWGNNQAGGLGDGTTTQRTTPVNVSGLANGVVSITAGSVHSCALTTQGGVKCWGLNFYGQLGDGSTTDRLTAVAVSGLTSGITSIVAGSNHTCALSIEGVVKCWGYNLAGQLGDGTTTTPRTTPVEVLGLTPGVATIAAGSLHTCALALVGGVKCWGRNVEGQLGDGTMASRTTPVDVVGLTGGVASISGGSLHNCVLTVGGATKCWGNNSNGQLGDGTAMNRSIAVDVSGFVGEVGSLAIGDLHTCAMMKQGAVRCWGSAEFGQLGDGTTIQRTTPVDVSRLATGVASIATGDSHTCALTKGGGVKCWGSNTFGQLGDGTTISRITAADVSGLTSGVVSISAGFGDTCALTAEGGVKCWGWNFYGQLGDGTTINRSTPIDVSGLASGVLRISAGDAHTCALTTGGEVKCWGANFNGQLGEGGTMPSRTSPVDVTGLTSGVVSISAGSARTCALMMAGGVKCWGWNFGGGLGDGTMTDRSTPVDVSGLTSGVSSISAGGTHTCAVTTGGRAKCWGRNFFGLLGDGTTVDQTTPVDVLGLTSGVASISAGFVHTCAQMTSGGVKCWGNNANGQLGDGTTTQRLTAVDVLGLTSGVERISASGFQSETRGYTCVLTSDQGMKCWGSNESGQLGDGNGQFFQRLTPVAIKVGQSITFTPPTGLAVGVAVALSATATSGLPVTFDTWTPATCSVIGNVVTTTTAGLCGIRASQKGDGNNAPAPQQLRLIAVVIPPPTMATPTSAAITETSATLGGTVVSDGGSAITERGFVFALTTTNANPEIGSTGATKVAVPGTTGAFPVVVSGLIASTQYSFKAFATNAGGTGYTSAATFATLNPTLSINDVSVSEGAALATGVRCTFTVTLSSPSPNTITVSYATQDGTATAPLDYVATSGSLTFSPGQTSKTLTVMVVGDLVVESNEAFGVVLSGPTNATIAKRIGQGTILNDDAGSAIDRPQPSWQEFFAVDTLETPYVGDFDGDGKTDIITFTRQNPNAIGDVYVALSTGTTFGANTKWHDFFAITTDETVVIGDYNGDGKDDIGTWLTKTSRQVYVALSTGSGMLAESPWVNSIGTDPTDLLFAGDANGDGKDDLIAFARKEGKVYVALSDGTKFNAPTVWHGFFAVSTYERPRVADVNGDGKVDIVTFATDSPTAFGDVYVATSDGTQFVGPNGAPNDSSKWHDFFAIRPTEEIRIGDLNGDGKDDFFTFLPPPFAQCYSVLSQGTSMADNALWAEAVAPLLGKGDNVYVGDVNGDGKTDIIIFAQSEGKVFVSVAP